MRLILGKVCLLLLICMASPTAVWADGTGKLFSSVDARLSLMKPVAAWKLDKGVAVEDLARERVVLSKAAASAEQLGISAESTLAFFQAQIEAAKEIQRCWIGRWQSGASSRITAYPDLKSEIRPDLIRLGRQILTSFKSVLVEQGQIGAIGEQRFSKAVQIECLSSQTAMKIFSAMQNVRLDDQ